MNQAVHITLGQLEPKLRIFVSPGGETIEVFKTTASHVRLNRHSSRNLAHRIVQIEQNVLSLAAGLAGTLWQAHLARQARLGSRARYRDARFPRRQQTRDRKRSQGAGHHSTAGFKTSARHRSRRALASIEQQLGFSLSVAFQYEKSFRWLRKSSAESDSIAAAHPSDLKSLQDAGVAWETLGKQLGEKGGYVSFDSAEPRALMRKSVADLQSALKLAPEDPHTLMLLANTWESIGRSESLGDPAKGIEASFIVAGKWVGDRRHSMKWIIKAIQSTSNTITIGAIFDQSVGRPTSC